MRLSILRDFLARWAETARLDKSRQSGPRLAAAMWLSFGHAAVTCGKAWSRLT